MTWSGGEKRALLAECSAGKTNPVLTKRTNETGRRMSETIAMFTLKYMQYQVPKSEDFDSLDNAVDQSCYLNAYGLAGCCEVWDGDTLIYDSAALSHICFEKYDQ
jgi:hypothetical protein